MIVLYDGWPLLYDPNSPAALHLLAVLSYLPEEVQAHVALPGDPPGWLSHQAVLHIQPAPGRVWERLRWEQSILPSLAGRLGANLVHLTMPNPALFGRVPSVISPTGLWEGPGVEDRAGETSASGEFTGNSEPRSIIDRLRRSLGQGGMTHARGLFWPSDLPYPEEKQSSLAPVIRLPPVIHASFSPPSMFASEDLSALELPETFVLYHGPRSTHALQRLLNAWSWAANVIGEQTPLVLLGMQDADQARLKRLLPGYLFGQTVRAVAPVALSSVAEIYRACAALFHPAAISPWGSPVRHALACGRPVVAAENGLIDALVGPAAYLAPIDDARALGAAVITAIVEEEVFEHLSQAALQRAAAWDRTAFAHALLTAYRTVCSS
jgi:glycosyltransferase involved in cell wall biosynthesis